MIPGAAIFLALVAIVVPAFFLLMWIVGGYNRLDALRKRYRDAFAQIDVLLKQRFELIPNLVESAKSYLNQDPGTVEAVIAARKTATAAGIRAGLAPGDIAVMKELSGAESALQRTLVRLSAVLETHPDFNDTAKVSTILKELLSLEDNISAGKQAYNDAVMSFNTLRETFPNNLIAVPFSFGPAESLAIENHRISQPV